MTLPVSDPRLVTSLGSLLQQPDFRLFRVLLQLQNTPPPFSMLLELSRR
jgi:hypothetical protein